MFSIFKKFKKKTEPTDISAGKILPGIISTQNLHVKVLPWNSYLRVKEFMEAFGHPVMDKPTPIDDSAWLDMRLALIHEELCELYEACGYETAELQAAVPVRQMNKFDVVAVADALGDLEYVVNGMALGSGINLPKVVEEIHRSNMTKLGADGKPIYREDGKILKGPNYEPPRLEPVLGLAESA